MLIDLILIDLIYKNDFQYKTLYVYFLLIDLSCKFLISGFYRGLTGQ